MYADETIGSDGNETARPSTQQSSTVENGNYDTENQADPNGGDEHEQPISMSETQAMYMKRRASNDSYCMWKDGTIKMGHSVKRRLHEDIITAALRYILDRKNVKIVAWGTKRIRIRG